MKLKPASPTSIRLLHPYIGRLIKKIRLSRNLTQEALANKSGVSRTTISRLENGRHKNIGVEHLESLAHHLGMSLITCIALAEQCAQACA